WLTWWLGDFAGAVVVAPVVVLWAKSEPASLAPPEIAKTGLIYLAAATSGAIVFWPFCIHDALIILCVLPFMLAALWRGQRDTATAALIVSAFVVWCAAMQCGPFARSTLNDSYIMAAAFMISIALLSLALSAAVSARGRIENQQRRRALETEVL